MPFDPAKPANNSPLSSTEMRGQFTGLLDVVTANHGLTSNNSNTVNMLNMTISDPPSQGELQILANKVDELISALRR